MSPKLVILGLVKSQFGLTLVKGRGRRGEWQHLLTH